MRTEEHRLIEQLCADLNKAHSALMRIQGATFEQADKLDWPDWTPQANSIRWAERLLGKPLSKTSLLAERGPEVSDGE